MKRKSAFTLIELLVVIGIIALLIAILVPSLASAKRITMQTRCGTQLKGIGSAMALFNGDFNRIPVGGRGDNSPGLGLANVAGNGSDGPRTLFHNRFYPSAAQGLSTTDPETSSNPGGVPVDGLWTGLPNALANYLGGGNKTKILVCPATQSVNPFNQFWDPDIAAGTIIGGSARNLLWYGNYLAFMGDPGNTYPTIPSFYTQVDSNYTSTGVAYDNLNIPVKPALFTPDMILMQDAMFITTSGANAGVISGNHPAFSAGTLVPDSYPASNTGGCVSASYSGNKSNNFSGANVLFADFHVDFIATSNLTQVAAPTPTTSKVYFLGSPNYK